MGIKATAFSIKGEIKMIDSASLKAIFEDARTHHTWQDKDISDETLRKVYDLCKMGPTSTNCCPMRLVFLRSHEEKEKLKPCLMEANIEQTMAAPVTAIIAYDLDFHEKLPVLSPHNNAYSWFAGNDDFILNTAKQNGTLQGAYFIIAARALGLDCGPMSGFNPEKTDEVFFKGTKIKSNFLCNLGHGDPSGLYPRGERLSFEDACKVI